MVDPKLGPRHGATCLITESLDRVDRSTADHVANLIGLFRREMLERWYECTAVLALLTACRERVLRSLDLGPSVGLRHVFAVQRTKVSRFGPRQERGSKRIRWRAEVGFTVELGDGSCDASSFYHASLRN